MTAAEPGRVSATASHMGDLCAFLGGVMLQGWRVEFLEELRREGVVSSLGKAVGGELGDALQRMEHALGEEGATAVAAEYVRLMVANADGGARGRLPVPPWEDCYFGGERRVMGERSRSALKAYAAARLGFDGSTDQPADHIGLELAFVGALLGQEARGERDTSARVAFVEEHVKRFAPAFGRTLMDSARVAFWREAGRAISLVPGVL